MVIPWPRCKFLVSRHKWRRDVVRHEERISVDMKKLDHVIVAYNPTTASFRKRFGGYDLPKIVRIVMGIASNLLTCEQSRHDSNVEGSRILP